METSGKSVARRLRSWRYAAVAAPRLAFHVVRQGILPSGLSALETARAEGWDELHWKVLGDSLVRVLRNAGPLLTKFGQVLSTRQDLLPATLCARLEALYADQPAMPRRQLERALKSAYGRRRPFGRFDPKPLGVGSIGQVHRARLRSGETVIVKILRPGVAAAIERDLGLLRLSLSLFLGLGARRQRATRSLLARALEDLAAGYAREADLRQEAASLADFHRRFEGDTKVVVPRCYPQHSCETVLVMEELRGEPISAYRERARTDPAAARRVADLALTEILRQVFEDGRFHADPHGGNLLILEDGRLGLIDLGATGELSQADRKQLARAVRAFLSRDADGLLQALLDFGVTPPNFDAEAFRRDVLAVVQARQQGIVARLTGTAPGESETPAANSLEELVMTLFGVAHEHGLYVPPSTVLFIKTLVTIEGVARSLHPELNLATTATPVILRSLAPPWMRWMFGGRRRGLRDSPEVPRQPTSPHRPE